MNKSLRRNFTDAEKLKHIENYGLSKQSMRIYCSINNIGFSSLKLWARNLKRYGKVTLQAGIITEPLAPTAPETKGISDIKEKLEELEALKLLLKLGYTITPR